MICRFVPGLQNLNLRSRRERRVSTQGLIPGKLGILTYRTGRDSSHSVTPDTCCLLYWGIRCSCLTLHKAVSYMCSVDRAYHLYEYPLGTVSVPFNQDKRESDSAGNGDIPTGIPIGLALATLRYHFISPPPRFLVEYWKFLLGLLIQKSFKESSSRVSIRRKKIL